MARIGLTVEHPELLSAAEQQAAIEGAGIDQRASIAPRTSEDWHYRLREVLDQAAAGDTLVIASLSVLGFGAVALLDALQAIADAEVGLVCAEDGIDTAADETFLTHVSQLNRAIDAGRLVQARALIAQAAHRGAVTPPKARLVDRAAWERAQR
ncbi:recombinase family protein [Pseudoclavibacter soli]|uniref:recombinase family protein n=1 Tax=Pseudoclavibacter soli TaxID=452623 RepID=UPI0003F564CF|nr:recombinase family protein [Pseudoclavibacter soli]